MEPDTYWPLTYREMGVYREKPMDIRLEIRHIATHPVTGYAYPEGDRRRYTDEGWAIWQKLRKEV